MKELRLLEDVMLNEFNMNSVKRLFNKLPAEEKGEVVKTVYSKSYKRMYKRVVSSNSKNLKDLMRTKGDFTKYKGYKDLNEVLRFIERSIVTYEDVPEDARKTFRLITEIKAILEKKAPVFRKSFTAQESQLTIVYLSLATSVIALSLKLLSTYYEIKDDGFNYKPSVVKQNRKLAETHHYETLNNFLTGYKQGHYNDVFLGKTDEFLEENNDLYRVLSGIASMLDKDDPKYKATAVGAAIAIGSLAALVSLRWAVSWVFNLRVDFAEHLRETASTLDELSNDQDATAEQREKKVKYAQRYRDLADKIDLDDSVAADRTSVELEKEDKEVQNDIKELDLGF